MYEVVSNYWNEIFFIVVYNLTVSYYRLEKLLKKYRKFFRIMEIGCLNMLVLNYMHIYIKKYIMKWPHIFQLSPILFETWNEGSCTCSFGKFISNGRSWLPYLYSLKLEKQAMNRKNAIVHLVESWTEIFFFLFWGWFAKQCNY